MRRFTDAGVTTLLLYNSVPDFFSHCTLLAMTSVAHADRVPLVDSSAILEAMEQRAETRIEERLALIPDRADDAAAPGAIDAVVRVDMATDPFGRAPYVMGNADVLGRFVPNSVPLYDDATHGDQRAGDGVWSRRFRFSEPQILTYAFTNGSAAGEWTGLENYRLRAFVLRPENVGRTTYLPIAQFGTHLLRSDSSHPDAVGHRAIAGAVAAAVRRTERFRSFTRAAKARGEPADGDGRGPERRGAVDREVTEESARSTSCAVAAGARRRAPTRPSRTRRCRAWRGGGPTRGARRCRRRSRRGARSARPDPGRSARRR